MSTKTIAPRDAETGDTVEITIRKKLVDVARLGAPAPDGYAELGTFDLSRWGIADGDEREVVSVKVVDRPTPPEPEWQPGDVVKAPPYTPFLRRSDDTWMTSGTHGPDPDEAARAVSEAWVEGDLRIIWKDEKAVSQ